MHPKTSPTTMYQSKFWCMARRFDLTDNSSCFLLSKVGAPVSMPGVKLHARRHILQLASSLKQYFDRRMAEDVYERHPARVGLGHGE